MGRIWGLLLSVMDFAHLGVYLMLEAIFADKFSISYLRKASFGLSSLALSVQLRLDPYFPFEADPKFL